MHYTGTIYRPPFEARSLLLQVTTGCSHNRCSFCTMYRDEQFGVEPLEQVEADLQEAREYVPNVTRVFLENGDPFVLSADRLEEIAVMVHAYLPKVETIAMYASIKNVIGKTDEELKRLRILGINELNIGVESGLDDALSYMNKGFRWFLALNQCQCGLQGSLAPNCALLFDILRIHIFCGSCLSQFGNTSVFCHLS